MFPSTRVALFALTALALLVGRIWLAKTLPPLDLEIAQWAHAQTLQWSYADSPPLTAYLVRLSTAIWGNTVFALRFPALVLGIVVSLLLLLLTPRSLLGWAVLLTPVAWVGTVVMAPGILWALFWLAYMSWMGQIHTLLERWNQDPVGRVYRASPVPWWLWIVGGALMGLGLLSHYAMSLALLCGLPVLVLGTPLRAWGMGWAVHAALALVVASPIFLFSHSHQWVPFAMVWAQAWEVSIVPQTWGALLKERALWMGLIPWIFFPWVVARYRDFSTDPRLRVYFWFFAVALLASVLRTLWGSPSLTLAVIASLGLWPLADRLISWSSFKGWVYTVTALVFTFPWAGALTLFWHVASPLSGWAHDPLASARGHWAAAQAARAVSLQSLAPGAWLYAPEQWVARLALTGATVTPIDERACTEGEILAIQTTPDPPLPLTCFAHHTLLAQIPVVAGTQRLGYLWVARYHNQ